MASRGATRTTAQTGPRGREAVRQALIEAAAKLCGQRSPALVSVRDIAAEAGVNHGQVHHYFGSKEGLIAQTLKRLDAEIADQVITEGGLEAARIVAAAKLRPAFLRLVAWVLLESDGPPRLEDLRFGRMLTAKLQEEGLSADEALVATTEAMTIAGGWALLEPALTVTNRLDDADIRAVQHSLDELVESVLSVDHRSGRGRRPG